MRFYAGIGSRNTPEHIRGIMMSLAITLESEQWVLRSGGAKGADTAFEAGAGRSGSEIYLPWGGYNGRRVCALATPTDEAIAMAAVYHPNWLACKQGARKLHGRNCHIVLGRNLNDPVDMIICWTLGGAGRGGTGQALRMTRDYTSIKIFDLAIESNTERIRKYIKGSAPARG